MKNIVKAALSFAVAATFSVAPLTASAYSIGVRDSINSSIEQGHTSSWDNYNNKAWGTESGQSYAYKSVSGKDDGSTRGLVIDPATTNASIKGDFHVGTVTTAKSSGKYENNSSGGHNLSGGSQVNTSLSHDVGTYFNP